MMRRNRCLVVSAVAALALAGAAQAQTQVLYVTDGDSDFIKAIQGGMIIDENLMIGGSRRYRIAVTDTIWLGDMDSGENAEYTLGLDPTGNMSPTGVDISEGTDGATDGMFNYTVESFVDVGSVYQYNGDWSGGKALFSVTGTQIVGITYDTAAGTLWISDQFTISQYDMVGNILSSFAHDGDRGALAYEAATDSLWYVPNTGDLLRQYSKGGDLMQTIAVGYGGNVWGAEFAIPGPGALALLGLAGLSVRRRRR